MARTANRRTFTTPREPHTIIIARGESVRHFSIGRKAVLAGSFVAAATMASAAFLPAWYFFADDVAARLNRQQWNVARSYEQRIDELRTKLDNAVSRRFLSEKMVETKVDVLLDQQEQLEARYDKMGSILDLARKAGMAGTAVPTPVFRSSVLTASAPSQDSAEPDAAAVSGDASARVADMPSDAGGKTVAPSLQPADSGANDGRPLLSSDAIGRIGRSLDDAKRRQIDGLEALAEGARKRTVRLTSALKNLGMNPPDGPDDTAKGGPFEPVAALSGTNGDGAFERSYNEAAAALRNLGDLHAITAAMPLDPPMSESRISSTFGVRTDPFLGLPALHSGIDYAAPSGTPVRIEAAGKVVRAEPDGGYGNLVEVDHGNGVSTRYAHLSRIAVTVGQTLGRDALVGYVGSTGRSTGAHLHYEIRIDGHPIDPERVYDVGRRLGGAA